MKYMNISTKEYFYYIKYSFFKSDWTTLLCEIIKTKLKKDGPWFQADKLMNRFFRNRTPSVNIEARKWQMWLFSILAFVNFLPLGSKTREKTKEQFVRVVKKRVDKNVSSERVADRVTRWVCLVSLSFL